MKFDKNKVCVIIKKEIDSDFLNMEHYYDKNFKKKHAEALSDIKTWEYKLAVATKSRDKETFQNLLNEAKEFAKMENIEYYVSRKLLDVRCNSKYILDNLCSMLKFYKDVCE